MVQRLLSGADFKMDPMVSLYYFAPACAAINGVFTIFFELPTLTMADINHVGMGVLLLNALVAFGLNVAVVLLVSCTSPSCLFQSLTDELIGKTSAVVLTLSGVLKDILLVMASMGIFGDPVTLTQYFGYSIALAGLMYYKLGGEKMQQLGQQAKLTVQNVRRDNPAVAKAIGIVSVLGVLVLFYLTYFPGEALPVSS